MKKQSSISIFNIAVFVAALGYFVDIYDLLLFTIVRKPSLIALGVAPADMYLSMVDVVQDSEAMLARFNKLIQEILRGSISRNTFRPWEVEILLDIESCNLREVPKREILRRYQKAVQRAMEKGAPTPLKLSEYLEGVKSRRQVVATSSP